MKLIDTNSYFKDKPLCRYINKHNETYYYISEKKFISLGRRIIWTNRIYLLVEHILKTPN